MTSHRRLHQRSAYWTRCYKWQQVNIWMKHRYMQRITDDIFKPNMLMMHITRSIQR